MKKTLTTLIILTMIITLSYGQKKKLIIEKELSQVSLNAEKTNEQASVPFNLKTAKEAVDQDFEGSFPPFGWWLITGGGDWDKSDETDDHTSGSGFFARYDCYNISDGAPASLVLPTLAPTSGDNTLSFWVNYYLVGGDYGQASELYVDISTDFGETWTEGTTNIIDGQHGAGWFEHTVDLSSHNGGNVTVRLRAISDYGSYNIAIDDVTGPEKYVAPDDAGISAINEPEGLLVANTFDINATLSNYGSNDLTSVDINTRIRDTLSGTEVASYPDSWTGTLTSAQSTDVTVANHDFSSFGVYNILSSTQNPNGANDPIFTNDQSSQLVKVIEPGMIYEDYESGEFPSDWTAEESWAVYSGSLMNGSNFAGISQQDGDPAQKLITPQLSVQSGDKFIFLLGGQLNEAGASNNLGYSTLEVKYSSSPDGSWTTITTFDMASEGDDAHYVSVDLNSLAGNDYYFAFETVSDFYYETDPSLGTYVFIDDVIGPVKASTADNDVKLVDLIYQHDFIYEGDNATLKAIVQNIGVNDQSGNTVTFSVDGSQVGTANIGTIKYLEKDTVSVQWTSTERGKYNITASLEADDNSNNNDGSTEGLVVRTGQLLEGFENVSSAQFQEEWTYDSTWVANAAPEGSSFAPYEGDSCIMTYGDADGGTYSNIKMITPKLERTGALSKLYFYAKGVNISDTTTTSVQLKYSMDTSTGNWYPVNAPIDLTDKWSLYEVDLGSVPYGEVYFAFVAASDWEYQDYVSYVMIDHVVGINYPGPGVQYAIPYDGDDQVALDSTAIISFDEDVTEVDFSGITIEGATEGQVGGISATLQADNRTIHIDHDPFANNNEQYTVNFPAGAVKNAKQVGNEAHSWSFTTIMAPPQGEYYVPGAGDAGVALDAEVLVRLNQEVSTTDLSGVTIEGATEGLVGNVSATLADDNKTIEIAHDAFANTNEQYTVTIPADAVNNTDNVGNEQIQWSFTTKLAGQPVADTLVPANNETAVLQDAEVYVVFDIAVTEVDLSGVKIEGAVEGVVNTTPTLQNVNAANPDTLMIAHDNFANYGEYYTVTVPAGAVDAGGTQNAKITWQFRSLLPPPMATTFDPVNGATGVSVDKTLAVTFDQNIYENDFSNITVVGADNGAVSGISASISGNTLNIMHDALANEDEYTVTIPTGTVINDEGVSNQSDISWSFTSAYPVPQAVSYTPANGAVEIPVEGQLSVKFNVDVDSVTFAGILLEDPSSNSVGLDSSYLNEADSTAVMFYSGLNYGTEYTVTIPSGAVENLDGVVNDPISWSFTTKEYYTVTFNVAAENGDPIPSATISVNGSDYTTDGDGIATAEFVSGTYDYTVTKSNFEDASGSFTVSNADETVDVVMTPLPSTLNSLEEAGINIYPNPTDGRFYIENKYGEIIDLKIVNISGKTIINSKVNNNTKQINISKYADGIYFIKAKVGQDILTGKIIKK
jgi:hypothetical protein